MDRHLIEIGAKKFLKGIIIPVRFATKKAADYKPIILSHSKNFPIFGTIYPMDVRFVLSVIKGRRRMDGRSIGTKKTSVGEIAVKRLRQEVLELA